VNDRRRDARGERQRFTSCILPPLGQNITRVTLGSSGLSVTNISTLISGLAGPLAITTNSTGDIFVTEPNSGLVTALRYSGPACTN
jgi:hypothetical protein